LARRIYDVNYPPRENFGPFFETASTKGLPESDESISFAGDFYYQANAIMFSGREIFRLLMMVLGFRYHSRRNTRAKPGPWRHFGNRESGTGVA
jgi:hypothetical protein